MNVWTDEKTKEARESAEWFAALTPIYRTFIVLGGTTDCVNMLAVNPETEPQGIQPLRLPVYGKRHVHVVTEITPDEFEDVLAGRLELPYDWTLGPEIPLSVNFDAYYLLADSL